MSHRSVSDRPHGHHMLSQWRLLINARGDANVINLQGDLLDIPSFIAVAR